MSTGSLKAAVIGGIAGAVMAVGTVALAGNGVGGVFNLGVDNTVDGQTQLHGSTGGNPQLRVNNQQGTDAAVGVFGTHSASAGAGAGVQGETNSTAAGANGVFGRVVPAGAAGDSNGVKGVNNGAGRGVYGQGASGPGVYGSSNSGYGVWGIGTYGLVGGGSQGGVWATSASGSGVYGVHSAASGTPAGVFGETNSASQNATGILAKANATNAGRDNVALRAVNSNTNQYGMGVWGSIAGSGWGVLGESGANGIGVIGKLGGTGTGVQGQTGAGGVGVRGIGGKTGVYGQATDPGGYAIAANGDAGQSRSSGGFVKAMAYIDPYKPAGQQVVRCFNSQLAPQAGCGITATGVDLGRWRIDFGFDVSDRFVSVTPFHTYSFSDGVAFATVCTSSSCGFPLTSNQVGISVHYSKTAEQTNAPFYIVVL